MGIGFLTEKMPLGKRAVFLRGVVENITRMIDANRERIREEMRIAYEAKAYFITGGGDCAQYSDRVV